MTDAPNPAPVPASSPSPDPSANPITDLTQEHLEFMLRRAVRHTLLLGLGVSLVLWKAAGWRTAAMMATGAAISAVSILEWRRLSRLLQNRVMRDMARDLAEDPASTPDQVQAEDAENPDAEPKPKPRGGLLAAVFLVLRLTVFAAAIYGSLKCFRGSPVALICGLSLAMLAMVWEAFGMLRD